MRVRSYLVSAALVGFASTASATQSAGDEILVIGETKKEAHRQAQSYVRELGVAAGEKPTARWFDPICPRAIGLNPMHASIVERQLREVIRRADAPLAPAACEPNMMIAFTDGPKAVVRHVSKKSTALQQVPPPYVRELKSGAAPIRWWYVTEVRSRDGTTTVIGESGEDQLSVGSSSLISTQMVRAITTATVVVDVGAADGLPLRSVVDYAALVGLAEIRGKASPPNSILSLFDGAAAPRALTRRDLSFLDGLYRIHMDRSADQQQRTLVGQMVKETAAN